MKSECFYICLLLGGLSIPSTAIVPLYSRKQEFYEAVNLYNEQQYVMAQQLFDRTKTNNQKDEIQAESAYYSANCAIRLETMVQNKK